MDDVIASVLVSEIWEEQLRIGEGSDLATRAQVGEGVNDYLTLRRQNEERSRFHAELQELGGELWDEQRRRRDTTGRTGDIFVFFVC